MPRVNLQNTPYSLFFNGTSSIINVTSPTGYSALTTSFAFGAWIKNGTFLSATNYPSIVWLWGKTTFFIYKQSIAFNGNINGTDYNTPIGSLDAFKSVYDNWFHLSITYDGTIIYIYINGNLYTTLTTVGGPFTVVNNNLQIGNTGGYKFIGNMSNFFMGGYMTAQQIKTIYTNNNYPSNTIIQYPLNEGAGSIAYDITGNGNNGTITSGTYSTDVPFKTRTQTNTRLIQQNTNSSLYFAGASGNKVTVPITPSTSGGSMGFWFKPNYNNYGFSRLVSWAAYSGTYGGFELSYTNAPVSTLYMAFYGPLNNSGVYHVTSNNFDWNSWNFCAVTWTSTGASIYINNGTSQTFSGSTVWTAPTGVTFTIGVQTNNNNPYKGNISNFVYADNVQWNAATISAFYQGKIPPNPTVYLPLNEGSQSTAYDISGNGNNGTITSGIYSNDVPFKKRKLVNDNLVYNGDFEYAPSTNTPTNSNQTWIDGTSGGSASNTLFGWGISNGANSLHANAVFDNTVSHSGNWSIRLSTDGTIAGSYVQLNQFISTSNLNNARYIPCTPSTNYLLTGWMKTTYISGTASSDGAQLGIYVYNGSQVLLQQIFTTKVNTTTSWTQYQISFTTSSTAYCLAVNLNNGVTTNLALNAWFDDIVLVPTTTPTRTLIV